MNQVTIYTLKIEHNWGFFSCCSVVIHYLADLINTSHARSVILDTSTSFSWYKKNETDGDVMPEYFKPYDYTELIDGDSLDFTHNHQYIDYTKLRFDQLNPLVEKYFTPNDSIMSIVSDIERRYGITDYNNICTIFYRGNDKCLEAKMCGYNEFLEKARLVESQCPGVRFLIQSDETEFLEKMSSELKNSFYLKDDIRHMNRAVDTVDRRYKESNNEYSKKYLAITLIMSKCKYVVCPSGNCSLWIALFRKNADNFYQWHNDEWYIPKDTIKIKHSFNHKAGFFSSCSVVLHFVSEIINITGPCCVYIDTVDLFDWYKKRKTDGDIMPEYFKPYDRFEKININSVDFMHDYQYTDYTKLKFDQFNPLVEKYFSPNDTILGIVKDIEARYGITDYNNICTIFYRGNDKSTETKLCDYEEFVEKARLIEAKHPGVRFLIQSDETEFLEKMSSELKNSFYLNDDIRHINRAVDAVDKRYKESNNEYSKKYLAITLIMAKCRYVVCPSGNCSLWIALFRKNANNFYQWHNDEWYVPKNKDNEKKQEKEKEKENEKVNTKLFFINGTIKS